ncbi:poly-beta-1,6 N-acetyl-D-glucosamine export porin PgaA [Nitrosophilus kaiyonis]|uniref:poly-beta-1,6 N-acetyl-D-glucosamine export porin PgaA n=1 Tax=Nitrosophilus kaiyonis TaxID=2930200 RepID=UPI002491D2EA|nr:poly-beta-1,6 N-acetyl-D-glucosamine export porin PgaA [Nitrosophilus kaiyonis]
MKKLFFSFSIFFIFLNLSYSKILDYSYAIKHAKEGKIEIALKELKKLYKKYPNNKKLYFDYITILGWAGKYEEVIRLSKDKNFYNMPDYTLEIIAKSYRNLKDYKKAKKLYTLCLNKNPNNKNCRYGLILTYADAKESDKALKTLSEIKIKDYYYYFLKGYILESKRNFFDAFINYQKSYELNPNDKDTLIAIVRILDILGLPYLAENYINKNPKIFDKNIITRIKKDQIAFKIRWGELIHPNIKNRFKETDEALKKLNKLISSSKAKTLKEENPNILQARFDKLVALRDRYFMDEVIKEYKILKKEKISLPYYSLNAVGDAYLYKRKPEIAIKFYEKALEKNPKHFESKIGKFYCYVEMFKLKKAIKWIDSVDKNEPIWIKGKYENDYKLESTTSAALARYFADYMNEAQKRFERMNSIAPANVDIRSDKASVYKDRGWPRMAIDECDIALAYEKKHKNANLIKGLSLLDANRFKRSEKIINNLYRVYPEDLQVQRAKKLFNIYKNKNQLIIDSVIGSSSGGNIGNDHFYIESKLYSKPIDYYYRVYLIGFYSKSDVEEGTEKFKRVGLALEYKKRDNIGNIGFIKNKNIDKNGWFVDIKHYFNDIWIIFASYESYSKETPLRALKNGVYANRKDFILTYRANESRETNIEFERMDFNDSNNKNSFNISHYERLITGPFYKLNTTFSFSTAKYSKQDVIYFSPKKDRYIGVDIENIWHLYRRYSKAFSHVLGFSIGNYWQKDFGSSTVWSIRYEHRWEADDRFDLIYGLSRSKSYFDNDKEYDTSFYLTLDWRF